MYSHLIASKGKIYLTATALLEDAIAYFDFCQMSPLQEEVVFHNKGSVVRTSVKKLRPFSKQGFATFAGLPLYKLEQYRNREGEDWKDAFALIDQIMYEQKFSGAVAGLMNATMIKSDLGMVDRSEVTGKDGGPIATQDVTDEEKLYDEARRLGIDIAALGLGGSPPEE